MKFYKVVQCVFWILAPGMMETVTNICDVGALEILVQS